MSTTCVICAESIDRFMRMPITCNKCDFVCCRICFKRYLNDPDTPLSCMSCRVKLEQTNLQQQFEESRMRTTFICDFDNGNLWMVKDDRHISLELESSYQIFDIINGTSFEKDLQDLEQCFAAIKVDLDKHNIYTIFAKAAHLVLKTRASKNMYEYIFEDEWLRSIKPDQYYYDEDEGEWFDNESEFRDNHFKMIYFEKIYGYVEDDEMERPEIFLTDGELIDAYVNHMPIRIHSALYDPAIMQRIVNTIKAHLPHAMVSYIDDELKIDLIRSPLNNELKRQLQEHLYHPERIMKWVNAGNDIEDYLS